MSLVRTPIDKIPLEILEIILEDAAGPTGEGLRTSALNKCNLCLTCKDFAHLIYGLRRLWTALTIALDDAPKPTYVLLAIKNSGTLPLHLSLILSLPSTESTSSAAERSRRFRYESHRRQTFVHTYLTLMDQWFRRVGELTVECSDINASELLLEYLARMDSRNLRKISLSLRLSRRPEIHLREVTFCGDLTPLRQLSFRGIFPPSIMRAAGRRVTDLSIRNVGRSLLPYNVVIDTLKSFVNVRTLRMACVECIGSNTPGSPNSTITLRALRCLDFAFVAKSSVYLAASIRMPNLLVLRLDMSSMRRARDFMALCGATIGAAPVVNLRVRNRAAKEEMTEFINSFRSASAIRLTRMPSTNTESVTAALSCISLPNLQSLRIGWVVDDTEALAILRRSEEIGSEGLVLRSLVKTSEKVYKLQDGNMSIADELCT
ncbi:hypothetical protein B0H16DRAFT_1746989 [Mycena metata]|uniref:Uncharacterized protein n=1 Tax=Mycena metata TaxID=1033252 RepID=A0AAD7GUW4_9AGAR|nr:hypothetical protein B0H16DRAFT_1746989 [Mycena metata]